MKKVVDTLEYVFIFFIAYIIFIFAISVTKVWIYENLGLLLDLKNVIIRNATHLFFIFLLIYLVIIICNIFYNGYFVNKLNKRLKERRKRNEK